jgi:eukaryotic-like serine/threonine-protein kinase
VPGSAVKDPKESVYLLGANLVLGASMAGARDRATVSLSLLEAATGKVLRTRRVSDSPGSQHLPRKASSVAMALLQISDDKTVTSTADPAAGVKPEGWKAYIAAEELMRRPNDEKLDDAIAKYKQAVDTDPNFGLGYARLAIAYLRKYSLMKESATLRLAERNSDRAVQLAPDSAQTILSSAEVLLYKGRTEQAMPELARARALDPFNTDILMDQAIAFRSMDKPAEEEAVYRAIIRQRPNYWLPYNALGAFFYDHGCAGEALNAFEDAAAAAPSVLLPITNKGTVLADMKRNAEAIEAFEASLRIAPSEYPLISLGNIAYEGRQYDRALSYYKQALKLNRSNHEIYSDIGDCYDVTGRTASMIESYGHASDLLQTELNSNSRSGGQWMRLAFYDARAHRLGRVDLDIAAAEVRGASDVVSQLFKARAMAASGRKEQALQLVLDCLKRGMSPVNVDLAPELKDVQSDPRYQQSISGIVDESAKPRCDATRR